MTGGQENPATGKTLSGQPAPELNLTALVRALGVDEVLEVDPYDLDAVERALRYAVQTEKPSVVITNRPCVLIDRKQRPKPPAVNLEKCTACGLCFRLGCPAIESVRGEDGKLRATINPQLCTSCDVCLQVCRFGAIEREEQ